MNRYVEMGFTESSALEAIQRFGDDLHAGCHWLMTRESMGSVPKRLKVSTQENARTYMGSQIRFLGVRYIVDDFDERHALIRIRHFHTHTARWEHISDGRLEWTTVHHHRTQIGIPKAAWTRKVGTFDYSLLSISEEHRTDCCPDNVLDSIIHHGRPGPGEHWELWRTMVALTLKFVHEPSGQKPREISSTNIHNFRVEWMTYFHAISDVYSVLPDEFDDALYNQPLEVVLSKFPEEIRKDMALKIAMWKNPQPYMKKARKAYMKNCLPIVLFKCNSIHNNIAHFSVLIHDMTFVRPNNYESGVHMQLQRLFFQIFPKTKPQADIPGPMDHQYLQTILKHAQKKNIPHGFEPAAAFATELFPYQKKCCQWMQDREKHNPTSAWGWTKHVCDDGFVFYTSVFGHISLSVPNNTTHGGLLSQDVGMGKTVEMLALITTHKADGPTLVVLPTTMLSVWKAEAAKHSPSLSVVTFHGSRRTKNMDDLRTADIVLTTYRVVVNETNQHVPTMGAVRWGRIILDESHEMKTILTSTTRAVCRLYAPFRWCVSATPWPRGMAHVSSMLAFLGVSPFEEAPGLGAYSAAQMLVRHHSSNNPSLFCRALTEMTLWQTKRHVRLSLPPVREQTIVCNNTFGQIYAHLLDVVQARRAGDDADSTINSRTRILHYTRWLRQAAIHPSLNRMSDFGVPALNCPAYAESTDIESFLKTLGTAQYDDSLRDVINSWRNGQEKCSICMDAMDRPTLTPCHHMFCFDCIQSAYQHDTQRKCPLCRTAAGVQPLEELTLEDEGEVITEETVCYIPDLQGNQTQMPRDIHTQVLNSGTTAGPKIEKIIAMVQENKEKIIVFTQFHNAWKLLCATMEGHQIPFVSIEGKMSPKQRWNAIEKFQNDSTVRVFAMTTRTASVGITLTAGSHIVFLEPCEDEALRKQAIGRAWRIGQTLPVTVTTLQTEGTIDTITTKEILAYISPARAHISPTRISI